MELSRCYMIDQHAYHADGPFLVQYDRTYDYSFCILKLFLVYPSVGDVLYPRQSVMYYTRQSVMYYTRQSVMYYTRQSVMHYTRQSVMYYTRVSR